MVIKSKCGKCDYILSAPEEFRGKKLRCPECGEVNLIDDKEGETQVQIPPISAGESPPGTSPHEAVPSGTTSSSTHPPHHHPSLREEGPLSSASSHSIVGHTIYEERRLPRTSSTKMNLHLREVGEATLLFAYLLTLLTFIAGVLPFFHQSLSFLTKIIILLICITFGGLIFIVLKCLSALLLWLSDSSG